MTKLKVYAYTGKITQRKKAASWNGFWIKPNHEIIWSNSIFNSHQEMLEANGLESYEDAFDLGWIRGFFQSHEVGIESRSLVNSFSWLQHWIQEQARKFSVREVLIDLNGRSYGIPADEFFSLQKSNEIRPYQV
jgi:hypothetical protein